MRLLSPTRIEHLVRLAETYAASGDSALYQVLPELVAAAGAQAGVAYVNRRELSASGQAGGNPDLSPMGKALARRCLDSGSCEVVRSRDSGQREVAQPLQLAGYALGLAVPVSAAAQRIGAWVLFFKTEDACSDEALALVRLVARAAGPAVERQNNAQGDETRRLELEEAGRMASLGLLTASVAHELRGPVGALVLQSEDLRRSLERVETLADDGDPVLIDVAESLRELTSDIGAATERIREIVEQLSQLSRRDSTPQDLDLSEVVRDSLCLARPHLEHREIKLTASLSHDCYTAGRRDNLGQVILNLIFNAADACEGLPRGRREVSIKTLCDGNRVSLVVDDTGPGIPQEALSMIFRPFYTSKKRGRGTGLGLKICSDVVSAHGGHIEVFNLAGGGASFRVVLPRLLDGSGVHPLGDRRQRTSHPEMLSLRRVLVVDDDPIFTRTIKRALRPHDVRTAANAWDAEDMLLDPNYAPDLVLCDIFLPERNGNWLHRRIADVRPELAERFVFVTGGALGKDDADYITNSGRKTLSKPLDLSDIVETMRRDCPDANVPSSVSTLSSRHSESPRSSVPPSRP